MHLKIFFNSFQRNWYHSLYTIKEKGKLKMKNMAVDSLKSLDLYGKKKKSFNLKFALCIWNASYSIESYCIMHYHITLTKLDYIIQIQ